MKFRLCVVIIMMVLGVVSASCVSARDFIIRNAATSAAYFKVDGTLGYVGMATSTPSYQLDVVGTSQFSQPVIVGTPTANIHATTKSYVDSMFTGSGQWTTNGGLVYLTSTTQNVGIGTTGPGSKLHINSSDGDTRLTLSGPGSLNGGLQLFMIDSGQRAGLYQKENGPIEFYTNATEAMRITAGGNVGIGTTSPGVKLEINGGVSNGLRITNAGGYPYNFYVNTDSKMYVDNNGTKRLVLDQYGDLTIGATANIGAGALYVGAGYFTGNVGIATTTPSYALTVNGTGWFNQPVIVGTPTADNHAATRSYVDSILSGSTAGNFTTLAVSGTSTLSGNIWFNGAVFSNLNMNGKNISGIGKLTVTTIDPLYQIEGEKYSTYAASIAGGVKEEFVGRGRLTPSIKYQVPSIKYTESSKYGEKNTKYVIPNTEYSYTIDFSKVERGSDLWVWYKAIDFSKDNVEVLATAYGVPIPIAYTIENDSIIFTALSSFPILGRRTSQEDVRRPEEEIEFSFRLVGRRVDWRDWPTYAKDQSEPAGLIIR